MHKITLVQEFPKLQMIEGKRSTHEKSGIYLTLFLKDSRLATAKVRMRWPLKLLYYLTSLFCLPSILLGELRLWAKSQKYYMPYILDPTGYLRTRISHWIFNSNKYPSAPADFITLTLLLHPDQKG